MAAKKLIVFFNSDMHGIWKDMYFKFQYYYFIDNLWGWKVKLIKIKSWDKMEEFSTKSCMSRFSKINTGKAILYYKQIYNWWTGWQLILILKNAVSDHVIDTCRIFTATGGVASLFPVSGEVIVRTRTVCTKYELCVQNMTTITTCTGLTSQHTEHGLHGKNEILITKLV